MNKFYPAQPDPYIKHSPDQELAKFGHLNALVAVFNAWSGSQTGLTAKAGGGQTGATQLIQNFNQVTTVATTGDSAVLPSLTAAAACTPCGPIAPVIVVNAGAYTLNVFPALGESIVTASSNTNAGVNTAVAIASGATLKFQYVGTTWYAFN